MLTILQYIILIAVLLFVFTYILIAFWAHISENIVYKLRIKYLENLLKQEIEFFEMIKVEEIPS